MEKIWEFFENMNEYLYVSSIESYELLYMNKKSRDIYGFKTKDEPVGKKCYEVIYGSNVPCAFCNNCELSEGKFKEWKFFNPVLNKYLSLKDTLLVENQKHYRLELAIDSTPQEYQSQKIQTAYENLEAMANEGFRIALKAPTPDKSIEVVLEYLGKALKGERTYIFEKNKNGDDDNTYEWVAKGISPEKDNLQNLPSEVCANWYRTFRENKNITIKNLEDIREEDPLQYQNLKRQNIHSLVVVPLYDDEKIIGFYGVDNPPGEFLDYAQNIFQIMAHFIISGLKRRELVRKLENMSYRDQLTQIGNRFALENYLNQLTVGDNIGVVYCDITGLKRVNDVIGHSAGDKLIIRACDCLKRIFGRQGLFRIGGDELIVLCPQITKLELKRKISELKNDMAQNSVVMAVGYVWDRFSPTEMDRLFSEAEKLMYDDKAAYYKTSGQDRRRQ